LLRFENPPYTTLDASIGTAKDSWTAELYVQNLTNQNKSTFTSTNQFVLAETILRPRVVEARIGYRF
jgi:outer membrane receptor protein involved in Fe transport